MEEHDEIDTIKTLLRAIGGLSSAGRIYLVGRLADERRPA
jgi:hypothetical protein